MYELSEYIRLDQDVLKRLLKASSEDKDERRLQDAFIKTNVCWVYFSEKKQMLIIN